jgi:hypothetical protein
MKTYLTFLLLICSKVLSAQQTDQELTALITRQDSLFWDAYNRCDTTAMASFFTEDVEFYHDKGGANIGLPSLAGSFSKNLCSRSDWHLKREPVAGTYKVFALRKDQTIYGAILQGEHVFYIVETGKGPQLDGHASFTHLWLKRDGQWKMKNVLSYDHGPAVYQNKRKTVVLPSHLLSAYAGNYKGPQTGDVKISLMSSQLVVTIAGKEFNMYAEKPGLFFAKERDLTFEFNHRQQVIVRENGVVVEELVRQP